MLNNIFTNALLVNKNEIRENLKTLVEDYKKAIFTNQDLLEEANKIDIKNKNGFNLDFKVIENIFNNIEKEDIIYGKVIKEEYDDTKKIMYGKEIFDIGNVVIINDGNPYVILEMILRNILVLNTVIFVNDGYMYGVNNLLINILANILEPFNIKYLMQIYITKNIEEVLANYANIDLVIGIGNHELQTLVLNKSHNKVIVRGYENFDLYIEDKNHLDFLEKIFNTKLNINIYILKSLNLDTYDAVIVSDIDEAIGMINYNSNKYAASIFTSSNENAAKFIRDVKASIVTINTSPTIERLIDIKESDLCLEKTIIYPMDINKL